MDIESSTACVHHGPCLTWTIRALVFKPKNSRGQHSQFTQLWWAIHTKGCLRRAFVMLRKKLYFYNLAGTSLSWEGYLGSNLITNSSRGQPRWGQAGTFSISKRGCSRHGFKIEREYKTGYIITAVTPIRWNTYWDFSSRISLRWCLTINYLSFKRVQDTKIPESRWVIQQRRSFLKTVHWAELAGPHTANG